MIRRRLLVIGAMAAVIGGFASWSVYKSLTEKIAPGVDVVVAARDIQVGERIGEGDLRVVNYRNQFLPSTVLHKRERVIGLTTLLPMAKGEFVLPYKIVIDGPGDSRLTAQIPVGMRAVQVPLNELESSSIKSGDRVDVLATGSAPGSNDTQTRTVLSNVRLLAIGSRAVTLVVSPEDAERLTLAAQQGRIKLVFRNPVDTTQGNTPAITQTTLYGGTQPRKARVKPVPPVPAEAPKYFDIQVIHGDHPAETVKFKQQ